MAQTAAILATTNSETLQAFMNYKSTSESEMALHGAGMGVSALAGSLAFEEVVVAAGTALVCTNPMIAVTAGAAAFFCGVKLAQKTKQRKENKKRVKYHSKSMSSSPYISLKRIPRG
jgi:hypothetical protein